MDVATVLRTARQTAGLSQRQLAARSGVAQSTLADAERARSHLSTAALDAALAACGLDLEVVARGSGAVSKADLAALEAHLRLSTTQRLHLALGGTGAWNEGPVLEVLEELNKQRGRALLPVPSLGLWLPGRVWDGRMPLTEPVDELRHVVKVRLGAWTWLHALPPLALGLACAGEDRRLLLAVASLLAMTAARDEGGRRPPPHRTADESTETLHLLRALTFAMHPVRDLPDGNDSRGWRLDQPVSLRQQLQLMGLPPRAGSRRRG